MADERQAQSADAPVVAGGPHIMDAIPPTNLPPADRAGTNLAARLRETEARLRLAEIRLRHIEDRYEALVAAAAQISWSTPPNGLVDDMPLWRRYTGQRRDQVRGWGWLDAVHPDDREMVRALWSRAVATHSPYQAEYRLRGEDGIYRTFLVRGVPVLEPDGVLREWIGYSTDITAHKEAEHARTEALTREQAARREAEAVSARLRAVLDVLPVGVIIADRDGRVLERNAAARAIWGDGQPETAAIAAERVYQGWWAATGDGIRAEEWALSRALTQGQTSLGEVINILSFDGQRKTILNSAAPIRNTDGEIVGGVVSLVDITERKRLEHRTRETLDALLAIAEAMARAPEAARDDERQIVSTTGAMAQRLLGLIRGLLGCERVAITAIEAASGALRPIATLGLAPEEEQQWQEALPRYSLGDYLTAEEIVRLEAGEVVVAEKNPAAFIGRPMHASPRILIAPLPVGAQLGGVLSLDFGHAPHTFHSDELALAGAVAKLAALVIERERLLRDRAAAQARALALQEANRRMDTFLSIASHELRTPMTSMKINIQMAERALRTLLDTERTTLATYQAATIRAHDLLVRADAQFSRQNRLVADLLDATRIKAGKLELRREAVDLAAIIRETVKEHQLAQPERAIVASLAEGPLPVFADADRISQVLTNYLSNALKYSAEEQPVSIWLRVRGRVAKVSVRDQGPGLPPVEQGRVWKRFYRVENIVAQSGSSVGLGLGLYLCRFIVEQHGGQVGLRSAPGHGATFWFTLPLMMPETDATDKPKTV